MSYRVYTAEGDKIPDKMHGVSCFAGANRSTSTLHIVGIPINRGDNPKWKEYESVSLNKVLLPDKEIMAYLGYIKRLFGGIYAYKRRKNYSFDRYKIDGLFVFIDKNKIKGDNKTLKFKIILTLIRYLFENTHRQLLIKALAVKKNLGNKENIISILLNAHINEYYHSGHSVYYNAKYIKHRHNAVELTATNLLQRKPYHRFTMSVINASDNNIQNTMLLMPVIKSKKLNKQLYELNTKHKIK